MTKWRVEPLSKQHVRSQFSCGVPALDHFLQKQVTQYEKRNLGRTHVVTDGPNTRVIGYYTLAAGEIAARNLSPEVAKRLPQHPIPAVLLARLAVDQSFHHAGVGSHLLRDAILRVLNITNEIGAYAVYVRATDETAARFYRKYGFLSYHASPLDLYLPLAPYNHRNEWHREPNS